MPAKQLATTCEVLFDLNALKLSDSYYYSALPLCVIDAVFSIGVKYTSTLNVVYRYCQHLNIEPHNKDYRTGKCKNNNCHTISQMIDVLERFGPDSCADTLFCNRQRTSSKNGILKAEAALSFAKILKQHGIESFEDLKPTGLPPKAEQEIKKIPGQTSGIALQYFYMLAGDDSLAKPDRHIIRFIEFYGGVTPDIQQAQTILENTVAILKQKYPHMTVRLLDHTIWDYMAHPPKKNKKIVHNKLVRDRIPEIIEASGKICKTITLDDEEYIRMLDAKLDEELAEYHQDQNLEELADLLEVIYAAAQARGYTLDELEAVRKEKAEKRGAFDKRIFLKEVIEP